jgi:hypothetical protein
MADKYEKRWILTLEVELDSPTKLATAYGRTVMALSPMLDALPESIIVTSLQFASAANFPD